MIYLQALENVLAALRPQTRKKVILELEEALKDTEREQGINNCNRLLLEVGSLKLVLASTKKVDEEYVSLLR